MGNTSSKSRMKIDPTHIFTSPEQVQALLLESLYHDSENRLGVLRALFDSRATRDDENGHDYWTENTFAEYLEERNADVAVATRDAGPLLYKMVINYGSFPFPPGQAQQLTCAIFLRGIYMMSRMKQRLFWRDNGTLGGEPCTRKRQPSDDVRLLFQSMADNESRTMLPPTQRSDVDDEDLIDVLFTLWDGIRERRNPKLATRRRDVLSAAATLPSSLSRNLEGTLNEADLGFLLQLIVKLLNTRFLNTMPLSPSDTTGCITEGFSRGLPRWEGVRWDAFHDTVLESLPNLLAILAAFFDTTFDIISYFWIEDELMPKSPRIQTLLSRSGIVCPEYFAQLLLIIPAGFALHFQDIQFQSTPGLGAQQTNEIATLLQPPGRLLVTKLSGPASNSDQLPTVLCVYTGTPRELAGYNFDPVTKQVYQMVFGLYPAQTVYCTSPTNVTANALTIRAEAGFLSLDSSTLRMEFMNELRQLSFRTGSTYVEGEVKRLEIWTM